MEVAPGIHRVGDQSMINSYLVEEAGQVTVVDAARSGFYRELPRVLASVGRSPSDVRALILTHGHSDHIGFAERLRTERRVRVMIHEADATLARGEVPNPSKGLDRRISGRSCGSSGSAPCVADCGHVMSARCPLSAMARPWTYRVALT
jgi:glyoxylase-like metal-dependent hydrolase (beta-lactamase superfamily II)